ncbi:hypothetical protein UlMin_009715 [Ulmus minor]
MATLSHSESRRLYSWWWDSHIPKNSKWLQENLTDMDAKVKSMIKLIEEDADSFARRAEMYYKKRPELMKLVEEFYRAYRALAERYDHATVELRHAHKTMAEAFPNQVPFMLADESPSGSTNPEGEPHTPEMPSPIHALVDPDDLHKEALGLSSTNFHALKRNGRNSEEPDSRTRRRGLKQLNEMFERGEGPPNSRRMRSEESGQNSEVGISQLSSENQNLKSQVILESERAGKAESEVQNLKKTLAKLQAEKDVVHLQFQQSLENLSNLERELDHAQKDAGGLNERASKAEIEIKVLKEGLSQLEAERDSGLLQFNQCLEKISRLEALLAQAQEDVKGRSERVLRAETESQNVKQELSRLVVEKEAVLVQYKQCLEKISVLETKISFSEENARFLNEQIERAQAEVEALKQALANLNEEREAVALQYKECIEIIAMMEAEISRAQKNTERLNSEIQAGAERLKGAEEQRVLLERTNQTLRSEADDLLQKISRTDQELSEKNFELKKFQSLMQEEHSRFVQVEATLQALQRLHSQSQEDQKALALELKDGLQMLKDLETCKQGMEEEVHRVKEENRSLSELNMSRTVSLQNLQVEILGLKEMKEKLEQEVSQKEGQSDALHHEIGHLREEMNGLKSRYQAIMEQVDSVGLDPECLETSVKDLQDWNSKLTEICRKDREEKEVLYKKVDEMDKLSLENSTLHSSLSGLNDELESLREKVKKSQESCQFLEGENSTLVAEKAALLSQLQIITENMQKLLERNTFLETSLSGANLELEQVRLKSKSLEEMCELLRNEKSNLQNERSNLVSQLENVEKRLGNLENRFTNLEEKYFNLEKEKESTIHQVVDLRGSLLVEKNERSIYMQSTEARLVGLQNHVHLLQEESRLGKKEFEEELDRAVNAQIEIFILQKFVEDLEEKNFTLMIERQKHIEASKLSDKLISELESENLEQQVEAEFLVDEIEKLRLGIHLVFRALQIESENGHQNKPEQEQISVQCILDKIDGLKVSLLRSEEEDQQLLVENSVLATLLDQLRNEGAGIVSEKQTLEKEFENMKGQHVMLQKDKLELQEMNKSLRLEVSKREQQEETLEDELKNLHVKMVDLQGAYIALQEQNSKVLEENRSLLTKLQDLKDEKSFLEEENDEILQEAVRLSTLSLVLESFSTEKAVELKVLSENLKTLCEVNSDLKVEKAMLGEKLVMKEAENIKLNESVEMLDKALCDSKDLNDQLSLQVCVEKGFKEQKTAELSEAEQKIKATENLNVELFRTVEELKMECEELKLNREILAEKILELSEDSSDQKMEIEDLRKAKQSLETEVGTLCNEIEEYKIREENLSLELEEKSNEFQLWEAEAATFYFDLQISSVREALLENKVYELMGVCENLEDERAAKSTEIEQMKSKVSFLESQIGRLDTQLSAYVPVVASLRENVASLEHNALLKAKLLAVSDQNQKGVETTAHLHEKFCEELKEDQTTETPDALLDLQKMQNTIKTVEKSMVEEIERLAIEAVEKTMAEEVERLAMQECMNSERKVPAVTEEIEDLKMKAISSQEDEEMEHSGELNNNLNSRKKKAENGILMKDIPLDQASDCSLYGSSRKQNHGGNNDQMLELWESAEKDCRKNAPVDGTQHKISELLEDETAGNLHGGTEQKFQNPTSGVQAERELRVDKQEVPLNKSPNQESNWRKILERLASDAQKLSSLQRSVQDLKSKMETKRRSKVGAEYEIVLRQLHEVEEAVVQLVETNDQLKKDIEESPSPFNGKSPAETTEDPANVSRNSATEQATKGAEKIGQLQFELQNIQYILLKLEDEHKNQGKTNRFAGSKTGVLLRDFIYSGGGKSPRRRRKARFCGCARPPTRED